MAPLTRSRAHPDSRVPERPGGRVLPAAGQLRSHHFRSHQRHRRWAWAMPPRRASGRTNRPKAGPRSPRAVHDRGRADAAAALACGPHFRSDVSWTARCREAPSAIAAERQCQPGAAGKALSSTPRALETERNSRHRRRLSGAARKMPSVPASTAWRFTAPTAICSTSSCRIPPIIAPTPMAAAARSAPA